MSQNSTLKMVQVVHFVMYILSLTHTHTHNRRERTINPDLEGGAWGRLFREGGFVLEDEERFGRQDRRKRYSGLRE